MKFHLDRDVLTEAVTWVARTLPLRPAMPVLQGVRIDAEASGVLKLSTFDYEVSAEVEFSASVDEAGTVLVSGKLLADIAKSLPQKPVSFELEGTKVNLTCGASRFTLGTMPVEEYPALPSLPDPSGTVSSQLFAEAVSQVTIAASRDETLPLLTGVRIEIEGDKLTLMATDRYRLAMRVINWNPATPSTSTAALVRARTLSDVAKSMGSGSDVTVALSESGGSQLIGFSADGRRTTSTLVDGDYPPVRRLFPESAPISAVVEVAALSEAVKRVALVAERNTPVRMAFSTGQVTLEAGAGEDAQASEALEADLQGEDVVVAFNPTFLLDGLSALHTKFLRLSFTDSIKPVVMTPQAEQDGENDSDYRYLLMPIRFSS